MDRFDVIGGRLFNPSTDLSPTIDADYRSAVVSGQNVLSWGPFTPVNTPTTISANGIFFNNQPMECVFNISGTSMTFYDVFMRTNSTPGEPSRYGRIWSIYSFGVGEQDFTSLRSMLIGHGLPNQNSFMIYSNFVNRASFLASLNQWYVMCVVINGGEITIRANGADVASGTIPLSQLSANRVRTGNDTSQIDSGFVGFQQKKLYYPSAHNLSTIFKVEGALAWDLNLVSHLASNHEFKNSPPIA